MVELHPRALDLVNKKFNLLLQMDVRDFDLQWDFLSQKLDSIKKQTYDVDDRILICHMDTDYYDELVPCGFSIINLIRMFKNKDIPLYLLLFVSNHYGIKKEFDYLLKSQHEKDRPLVIETLLSTIMLSNYWNNNNCCDFEKIEKAGLLMMGKPRSHRVALCNFIEDSNLFDQVAMSTNF